MNNEQIESIVSRIIEAINVQSSSNQTSVATTALITIIVFVLGQIIDTVFIKPIQKQRELIGKIAFALSYYANVYQVEIKGKSLLSSTELNTKQSELRQIACDLRATRYVIPLYSLLSFFNLVKSIDSIKTASSSLIGWSNYLGDTTDPGARHQYRKSIADALNLELE